MKTARQLRDDALRAEAGADPSNRADVEAALDALFERLRDHPEEMREFEREVQVVYDATKRSPAGPFVFRNVRLPWNARLREWREPPESSGPYDEMLSSQVPFRVIGEGWGMSPLSHPRPEGNLLRTGNPGTGERRVRWVDGRVACSLGARFDEVYALLQEPAPDGKHYYLENQPGFGGLTIAGALGTGGHGSGLRFGPLSSMAHTIWLLDSHGERVPFRRGEQDFDLAVTHLGGLGPIVGVELEVVPTYRIEERRAHMVIDQWRTGGLTEVVEHAISLQSDPAVHSADLWIAPYADSRDRLELVLGVRRITDSPISQDEQRPLVLRSRALQTLGRIISTVIASTIPSWIRHALRWTVRQIDMPNPVVMHPWFGLDFGAANDNPMAAIEMAFDLDVHGTLPVVRTLEILDELSREKRFVFSPMGVRFVGPGPERGLAPQARRARTLHIEVPTFANEEVFHGDDALAPLQRALASERGGRPHWGQRLYLSGSQLRGLWPAESVDEMGAFVRSRAPALLGNPLLDDFFG